jgi:hypothetical protein
VVIYTGEVVHQIDSTSVVLFDDSDSDIALLPDRQQLIFKTL